MFDEINEGKKITYLVSTRSDNPGSDREYCGTVSAESSKIARHIAAKFWKNQDILSGYYDVEPVTTAELKKILKNFDKQIAVIEKAKKDINTVAELSEADMTKILNLIAKEENKK